MNSNKTKRLKSGGLIVIKNNNKLRKDCSLIKDWKFLSIKKSLINRVLWEKYGKPLKNKKSFLFKWRSKLKKIGIFPKIIQNNIKYKKKQQDGYSTKYKRRINENFLIN